MRAANAPSHKQAPCPGKMPKRQSDGSPGRLDFCSVLPYKDENPTVLTPLVTVGIIVVIVLAWLLVQGAGSPEPLARSVCQLGLIPGVVLHTVPPGTAVPLGEGLRRVLTADANWWTLVTSMFMHGGWLH